MKRASRRAARTRLLGRWLRRIRAKWKKVLPEDEAVAVDWAVHRVDTHENIRNHSRRHCSWCNPKIRTALREKILDQDLQQEMADISTKSE
jgi:hypothetical protein